MSGNARRGAVVALCAVLALAGTVVWLPAAASPAVVPRPAATLAPGVLPIYRMLCNGIQAFIRNGPVPTTYTLHYKITGQPTTTVDVTLDSEATSTPIILDGWNADGTVAQPLSAVWDVKGATPAESSFMPWDRTGCPATRVEYTSTYVNTCEGVRTTVTNTGASEAEFGLTRAQSGIDGVGGVPGGRATLQPDETYSMLVRPEGGRGFGINWQPVSELDIQDVMHAWVRPAGCGNGGSTRTTGPPAATATSAPSPTPSPAATATTSPAVASPPDESGGFPVGVVVVAGVILVGLAALVWLLLARRRRSI
jgi:hypothetical protein